MPNSLRYIYEPAEKLAVNSHIWQKRDTYLGKKVKQVFYHFRD